MTSRLPGFHKLSPAQRRALLAKHAGLSQADLDAFDRPLAADVRERLVENVVGSMPVPLGVATNFVVNGREMLVPMAVEESSVVAAASHAAKIARKHGGFVASSDPPVMVAQVQIVDVPDHLVAQRNLHAASGELAEAARAATASLAKRGGGYRGFRVRAIDSEAGKFLVVHLHVDVRDAMGANAVNSVAERVAPLLAELTGGRPLLRILTNLADERVARASAVFDKDELGGPEVVEDMLRAWAFADADAHRAATHNKGVMNGIDAVVLATGNDWRATEAGAHAYAARTGRYRSLTTFRRTPEGHLRASIEVPLALGIVGGVTKVHPVAQASLRLLGVKTSQELAEIVASVGLAQNVAAVRALSSEGIQSGHMRLHAANLALAAGVPSDRVDAVVAAMLERGEPSERLAAEVWKTLRAG